LKVGNINIPNFFISNISAIFLGMMYNASYFADFELGITSEFEDNVRRPQNDMIIMDGTRNKNNMSTDYTSFLLNIQFQR
jgi:hypothetical protein